MTKHDDNQVNRTAYYEKEPEVVDFDPASDVAGIDISEARLARARSRYPTVDYVQGQLARLPFGGAEFDLAARMRKDP